MAYAALIEKYSRFPEVYTLVRGPKGASVRYSR
jgi:hypothetical protein